MFNPLRFFRDYRIDSVRVAMMAVVPGCIVYTMSEYQEQSGLGALDFFDRRLVRISYKGDDLGWFDVQITERSNGKKTVVNGYLTEAERRKLAAMDITVKCEVVSGFFDLKGAFKQQKLGKPRLQYCA